MAVQYRVNAKIEPEQLGALFLASGIRRPAENRSRLRRMIDHSNLIVTAWDEERLIGIARALTDFSWCCYLSDLAVDQAYQRRGIGRELICRVQQEAGEEATLLLLSAPEAMEYYPKIGLTAANNAWIVKRTR